MTNSKIAENKNVIVWSFPEPINTVYRFDSITDEENSVFKEFIYLCSTVIGLLLSLQYLPLSFLFV